MTKGWTLTFHLTSTINFKTTLLLSALLLLSSVARTAALEVKPQAAGVGASVGTSSAGATSKDTNATITHNTQSTINTEDAITTTESTLVTSHQEALVEWLLSKPNGFFNSKVKFQPLFPGGPNGMFATQPIAKNETILTIPSQCLLTSDLGEGPSYHMCDTTRHLVQEYIALKNTGLSDFAPYVNYIFEQKQFEKVPAAWSEGARILIQSVIGNELEPQAVDDMDFWKACGTPEDRADVRQDKDVASRERTVQLYTDAYRSVISRSWNDVMIPVYDMVNHRNGDYHNMDQLTTAHGDEDVVIVALRDIDEGEQLYISYNECLDRDCEGIQYSYILPQIMKDYGFVEQYPRRWRFTEDIEGEENGMLIELAQDEETGEISLTWLSEEPDRDGVSFLRGHLTRQQGIHDQLLIECSNLNASYERDIILEFHQGLMTALEMAIQEAGREGSALQDPEEECEVEADGSQTCYFNTENRYDDLVPSEISRQQGSEEVEYSLCASDHSRYLGEAEYEHLDETESFYQRITFEHNPEIDDTCLYLSAWLQTCSSWRPQYHESVVHVPASFIDNVTRVIYLGGGDNMMLHEVLKYSDSLEMVLGMELDQQVVRSSFKVLGNQPHFDNPKVQWWFGDATKSLNLLPEDYFGTFDLVIVDLQTNVIETLQVTPTKNIMDVAMELLKPEGILARNEDYYPRRSLGFAKYEVDLEYLDVPILCQQSITMGSKDVNFLAEKRKDHGIETVYLDTNTVPFEDWYSYRNNPVHDDTETKGEETPGRQGVRTVHYGVHMIIEVENVTLENDDKTRKSISKAISEAGFAEMSVTVSNAADGASQVYLFEEGYLLAQFWPKQKYVGFDLKLWSQFDNLERVKDELIAAVQGQATASFRVVTGGMSGLQEMKKAATTRSETLTQKSQDTQDRVQLKVESINEGALGTIVQELISLVPSVDSIVAVICPEKPVRCASLESLYKKNVHLTRKIIPVFACPGLSDKTMFACETDVLDTTLGDVEQVGGKIGGIFFDPDAPKAMGQILHTLFSDKSNRISLLLKEGYVVVYTSQESTPAWQRGLLERFQTEFDVFSPALRTQAFFNSTNSSVELGVFSCGNSNFYSYLVTALQRVRKETGLLWEVRKIEDGVLGYVAEFYPDVIPSNADYDKTDSLKQWSSQSPMGHQAVVQFGIRPELARLEKGEIVLVEYNRDVWKGEWIPGRVLDENDTGNYAIEVEGEEEMELERGSIRRLDFTSEIEVMDLVLIRREEFWSQGAVIEKRYEDRTFKVRRFDSNGDVITVRRQDMIPRVEANEGSKELPSLMTVNLSDAITSTLQSIGINIDTDNDFHAFWGIGSGCVLVGFWSWGSLIVVWDGKTHLDMNFFSDEENRGIREEFIGGIIEEIPILFVAARDDYPRGFGRVVNFQSDLESIPRWVEAAESQHEDLSMNAG